MLKSIDLSRKLSKADYKKAMDECEIRVGELQRRAVELGIPVIIVFEGWGAAGKGTLINKLILGLDPRGFTVHSTLAPNEEEALRPFLWRFWCNTPARGRITIFDRAWYRRVVKDRLDGQVDGSDLQLAFQDICNFERQLAQDGTVIIKFFLHISKDVQKKRYDKLRKDKNTAWRVTADDLKQNKQYNKHLDAIEEMISRTESDFAPWTVVESHDDRFATVKVYQTVISALEQRIAAVEDNGKPVKGKQTMDIDLPAALASSVLDKVDLSKTLERDEYNRKLKRLQKRIRELEHELYLRRVPVVLAFEGWDAAGKGGNIRRLTGNLDPRGYEVVPIAAPNDIEKRHHYLWRFWTQIPKAGHITIFDRTWYGRVLVERIEGFCSEADWKRAYREINEMEEHLANFGTIVRKFWLHIDPDEQLRRFERRQEIAHKQYKITDEDWRNREKWDVYKQAVDDMLLRTNGPRAPWVVVESNCKLYARIKVLSTVIEAIEEQLDS